MNLPHRIANETTIHFIPGLGDCGRTTDIVAIADTDELPSHWVRCDCTYDRCKRVVDHNPETGGQVESITCMACGSDLLRDAERERELEDAAYRGEF